MKNTLTICIILMIHLCLFGQKIEPKLISSSGGYNLGGDVKMHWAIGEVAVSTHSNGIILTEGFYQAYPDAPTALENPNLDIEFTIYPNPVKNEMIIDYSSDEELSLEVYNILGHSIIRTQLIESGTPIDLSSFIGGNYLAKISNNQGQYAMYKFIKI